MDRRTNADTHDDTDFVQCSMRSAFRIQW